MLKSYETFWNELAPYYPISKGTLRLPIATELITLPNVDIEHLQTELTLILELLLAEHGSKEGGITRATREGEAYIAPLINDDYSGIVRFDTVIDTDGNIKVLELNADYPDGLLMHDKTYSVLSGQSCTVHRDGYMRFFDAEIPVHVAHDMNAFFVDAYHTEYEMLKEAGFEVSIGALSNMPEKAALRRCLEVSKTTADDGAALLKQSPDRIVNSFALRTLGYKNLLESLDHKFVPKTYEVTSDTKELLMSDFDRWVLKPSRGCEGQGVHFGNEMDEDAWASLLDSVVDTGYVAQEFVDMSKRSVSFYDEGEVRTKELYFDLCPHFFIEHGKVVGSGHILMRFSEQKVVNVSKGGGIGYHVLAS